MFLKFKVVFRKLMIDLRIPFGFYCGDCLDRVAALFNSQNCVCECPGGVSGPWQHLITADMFFCFHMFTRLCSVWESMYPCTEFANGLGDQGSVVVESYQRLKKWFLMPPCLALSIIRLASRVKWSNPGKELRPPLHLGVVAIKKGAFGTPSTKVVNLLFFSWYAINPTNY